MTQGIYKRILKYPFHIPGNAPLLNLVSHIDHFMKNNHMIKGIIPPPIVTIAQNFDSLNFPKDHVGRSKQDTYYIGDKVLRTHATCHQLEMLPLKKCYWICDTYRRDEIDKTHYPIFHQMDGVKVFDLYRNEESIASVVQDLKLFLEKLMMYLLKNTIPGLQLRWVDTYFPFTSPSYELEAYINNEWLELLGCGVIEQSIMDKVHPNKVGWAFGIGIERVCMLLHNITDIRLFWSNDSRFSSQFPKSKQLHNDYIPMQPQFKPFSHYPPCLKDLSFFINSSLNSSIDPIKSKSFDINGIFEASRPYDEFIESVKLVDHFFHPKKQKWSLTFKFVYRAWDRNLTNEEINKIQFKIREVLGSEMDIELR